MSAALRACAASLALVLSLLAGGACREDDPEQVRPVSAHPRPPTLEDAGSADSGPDSGIGFIPRPGASTGGAAPTKLPISDLDPDGVAALCEELDARFAARIADDQAARFTCTLLGLTDAIEVDADGAATIDAAACSVDVEGCLSASTGAQAAVDCATLTKGARGCEVSSAELQACFDAAIGRLAAMIDVLSCETTTVEALDSLFMDLLASGLPECRAVVDDCPGLLPSIGPPSIASLSAFDGCADNCELAGDGVCDDGGDGSATDACVIGSDCTDCGPR